MSETTGLLAAYRNNPSDDAFELLYEQFKDSVRAAVLAQISEDLRGCVDVTMVVDTSLRKGIPRLRDDEIEGGAEARRLLGFWAKNEAVSAVRKQFAEKRSVTREVTDQELFLTIPEQSRVLNDASYHELIELVAGVISSFTSKEDQVICQLRYFENWEFPQIQGALVQLGLRKVPISTMQYRADKLRDQIAAALVKAGYNHSDE